MFASGYLAWAWLVLLMKIVSPSKADSEFAFRTELAQKIASSSATVHEQRLLVSIGNHETALQERLASPRCECKKHECDGGQAKGTWQIIARNDVERKSLCVSLEDDIELAVKRIRESYGACRDLPEDERLAIYARGSCSSEEGRKLSKAMWIK